MTMQKLGIAACAMLVPLVFGLPSANAATAHNSQAGASGNTSNANAPLHKRMKMHRKTMKKM